MDITINKRCEEKMPVKKHTTSKLDFLSEKVLSSSGILSKIPKYYFEDTDEPYLNALEKLVGIQHEIHDEIYQVFSDENSSTAALLTCTPNATNVFQQGSIGMNSKLPEYWSPPLTYDHTESSNYGVEVPTLEDAAPFTDEFYISLGQMIVYALSSVSGRKDGGGNIIEVKEKSSLYRNVDAVRVANILSTLIDLNVLGNENNRYIVRRISTPHGHVNDLNYASFLDLLLYYTEGSAHVSTVGSTSAAENRKSAVPLVNAIFKHFAVLPQLESHVHTMTRIYRATAPTVSHDGTSASLKIMHMKKTEIFQERLEQELSGHIAFMERLAGLVYEKADCSLRKKARSRMGNILHRFVLTDGSGRGSALSGAHLGVENTGAAGIDSILKIILRIVRGLDIQKRETGEVVLPESYKDLLNRVLLPLHKPSGMVLWRDQKPLLSLYHKTLVQCIGAIVSFDKDLIGGIIKYIIHPDVWPLEGRKKDGGTSLANTPKLVILLHEIDTLITLFESNTNDCTPQPNKGSDFIVPLILRLCTCISSDNSRSSERALEFFKNKTFKAMVEKHIHQVLKPLIRALCRVDDGMEVPWNPTVRKMTLLVLKELETLDKTCFEESCRELFTTKIRENSRSNHSQDSSQKSALSRSPLIKTHVEAPSADMISLKKSMGGWRPPTKVNVSSHISKIGDNSEETSLTSMPPPMLRRPHKCSPGAQPPLTITGVAPWAMTSNQPKPRRSNKIGKIPSLNGIGRSLETSKHDKSMPKRKGTVASMPNKMTSESDVLKATRCTEDEAIAAIRDFMNKLKPPASEGSDESEDGISSWAKAQSSESPVLLHGLKFHNLVFGQDLGEGAFSTVKYARLISKGKTRSHWPEYAVKVVSTQKIEELGYEKSINREISVLRMMGHPSISRLISAFRFRDGAYLVLEYCSGGDLHSMLKRSGSLDEDSTRFVIGEIIAALHYVHDLGFVYGDLKPENILITEVGHVKLTDFGACRPVTTEAIIAVRETSKNALKNLRDGDWHITTKDGDDMSIDSTPVEEIDDGEDDARIEGTVAYLPPEVVLGGIPTKAADTWALGCVLFQCLSGRPPLLDCGGETSTRQKIVTFELSSMDSAESNFFLESSGTHAFSTISKDLIKRLLTKDWKERPSMATVAEDDFFEGKNLFSLHRQPPHHLDVGKVAPSPNAQWSRRQFSSIWSPQPQAYEISDAKRSGTTPFDMPNAPIKEGDEREAFFLTIGGKKLIGISET